MLKSNNYILVGGRLFVSGWDILKVNVYQLLSRTIEIHIKQTKTTVCNGEFVCALYVWKQ